MQEQSNLSIDLLSVVLSIADLNRLLRYPNLNVVGLKGLPHPQPKLAPYGQYRSVKLTIEKNRNS